MKVVREGETTFKFYLDDREVFVQDFAGFEGGYFGVMSTGGGIFNNVNFTEDRQGCRGRLCHQSLRLERRLRHLEHDRGRL